MAWRKRRGISRRQAALDLDFHLNYLYKSETGRTKTTGNISRAMDIYVRAIDRSRDLPNLVVAIDPETGEKMVIRFLYPALVYRGKVGEVSWIDAKPDDDTATKAAIAQARALYLANAR